MIQRTVFVLLLILTAYNDFAQNLTGRLNVAIEKLSMDEQFKHAIVSLYVADGKTGGVVFDKNGQLGLAPASCQKVVTSVAAYELLGEKYQYKTYIDRDGPVNNGLLTGNLYITGTGDPTLGSDRWKSAAREVVLKKILDILVKYKISAISGELICNDDHFTNEPLPNGWVWEDIGNYYGAGAWGLNWRENQFDVTFKTGKMAGDNTEISSTMPSSFATDYTIANFVKTGSKGSGDNAYLFSAPFHKNIIARGTVPVSADGFTISGSMPDPPGTFIRRLKGYLNGNGIQINGGAISSSERLTNNQRTSVPQLHVDSILSPPFDSINYWFLKKSINLVGEALVKTIAFEKTKSGATDTGIAIIKEFWSKHGIEKSALKIIDGSGLSPANRVTTRTLVSVMQYAKNQPWFPSFYNALPEVIGNKMKDGYISGVRSYTGYLKNKNGDGYTFAFIINNFDGNPSLVREKIQRILKIIIDD